MLFVLSYLALLALIGATFVIAGLLVEQPLLGSQKLQMVRWEVVMALGAGLWIGLLFVYGSLGLLGRESIWATMASMVLLLVVGRRRRLEREAAPDRSPASTPFDRVLIGAMAVGVGFLMAALFVQALWPRVSWDANVYHLTVPRLYLESGGFYRIPYNVYSNWPLNTELLFAMAMALRSHILAKLVHFGFGCLCLLVVYRMVRDAAGSWAGWIGAILLLMNPIVLLEIRVAYVDLASALFLTLSFVALVQWLDRSAAADRLVVVAGVLAGLAAGTKLTGIVGVGCLALMMTAVLARRRAPIEAIARSNAYLILPAVALLTPWLIKSWLLTGNPVYPFLFQLFGGPEWSPELQRQLGDWQRSIGMGRSFIDYLLLPLRVILLGDRGYHRFDGEISSLWICIVPLSLWIGRVRPLVARALTVCGLYFGFWALSSQQMRFLIPILPLLAVAGAVSIATVVDRLRSVMGRRVAQVASTIVLLIFLGWAGKDFAVRSWGMLGDYLHFGFGIEELAEEPVYQFINDHLPRQARLLMLNTNHGFFCRREYVADSFFEASQIGALLRRAGSKAELARLLRDGGFTHVLIENRDRGIDYPASLSAFLNDRDLVERIYRSPDNRFDVARLIGAPVAEPISELQ